jgi:lipopolysaccharide/colanic/teichoic acid biosynthesis glycosyltransferase
MLLTTVPKGRAEDRSEQYCSGAEGIEELMITRNLVSTSGRLLHLPKEHLSSWSRSGAKRFFDCACVLLAMPLLAPVLLAIALAVWLTSSGPILFLQERVGLHKKIFTILKFRTMVHLTDNTHHAVTTVDNQRFTSIGPFLRRWKLDELPQLLNVIAGHMSLVGPRPKMPEHVLYNLPCRPGITGAATNAFAREEMLLNRVPADHLDAYYHKVVLPAKRWLDVEYMTRATFHSDLKLIVDSVLRRWDSSAMESALNVVAFRADHRNQLTWAATAKGIANPSFFGPIAPQSEMPDQKEQVGAF